MYPIGQLRISRAIAASELAMFELVTTEAPDVLLRAARGANLPGLVDAAARHGLLGVLAPKLEQSGVRIPQPLARTVFDQLLLQRLQHERLVRWLAVALEALEGAGIRAVCLKGPVLAERLYEDPVHRPSSDLDLMVREVDCERAKHVLVASGWRFHDTPSERLHRRHYHNLHLLRPHAVGIELHFRALVAFGTRMPAEPLLASARPFASRYGAAWVLSPEAEFAYLAIHAASHLCARLGWMYDLARLVQRAPALDFGEVTRIAKDAHLERALCLVLRKAEELGVPLPDGALTAPSTLDRLAEALRKLGVRHRESGPLKTTLALGYQALLSDRSALAVELLTHGVTRIVRRRAQRALPGLLPDEWSA